MADTDRREEIREQTVSALKESVVNQQFEIVSLRSRITALEAELRDTREVLADKRRLAREIDVAMHGEENAAPQASLCDLVASARDMRAKVTALEAERDRMREALKEIAEGRGTFSRDQLTFATSVIEEAKATARAALSQSHEGRDGSC